MRQQTVQDRLAILAKYIFRNSRALAMTSPANKQRILKYTSVATNGLGLQNSEQPKGLNKLVQ